MHAGLYYLPESLKANLSRDGIEVATNDKTIFITAGIINSIRINNLDIVKKLKLRKGDIFN